MSDKQDNPEVFLVSHFSKAASERFTDMDWWPVTDVFGTDEPDPWSAAISHAEQMIRDGQYDVGIGVYRDDDRLGAADDRINPYEVLDLGSDYAHAQYLAVKRDDIATALREEPDRADRSSLTRELDRLNEGLAALDSEYGNEPWRDEA